MGQQLEKGEEDAAARRRGEENKAVEEAHELILRLKEEVESSRTRTEAYEKERDMFRRMLAQRGGSTSNGGSIVGGNAIAGSDIEASRLLTEVQANFDAYKNEISIDTQRLREDLTQAQKDASAARTELAKSRAQAEFMSGKPIFPFLRAVVEGPLTRQSLAERFRLLNETYELREGEIKESQKRASELQQTMSKQDSSIHKVSPRFDVIVNLELILFSPSIDVGGSPRTSKLCRTNATREHQSPIRTRSRKGKPRFEVPLSSTWLIIFVSHSFRTSRIAWSRRMLHSAANVLIFPSSCEIFKRCRTSSREVEMMLDEDWRTTLSDSNRRRAFSRPSPVSRKFR